AAEARHARPDEDRTKPDRHPQVEAALEEIECQRPWRNEEDEDPDRPVIESVVKLVELPDFSLRRVLDRDRHGLLGVYPAHIPRRNRLASASARSSSCPREKLPRFTTVASPSRTNLALTDSPGS